MENKQLKCPYNQFTCIHTSVCGVNVEKSCKECEHYHNGVKATGAMPIMEMIYNKLKRLIKNTPWI